MIQTLTNFVTDSSALIDAVKTAVPNFVLAYLAISGACAGASAAWRKPENVGILSKIHAVINVIGWNIGHAVNKQ